MNSTRKHWQSPIAIIGMGLSGNSAKQLLLAFGYNESEILCFDTKAGVAPYNDPVALLRQSPKTLVVSPGVPLSTPWIKSAIAEGASLTSELSMAWSVLQEERVIGITGSVGKSTTTALLEAALKSFSPNSFVGGNIGLPLAEYARELALGKRSRAEFVVLELSSFQLENFEPFFCDLSVLTYLTANHLDRYSSQEAYYLTKWCLVGRTKSTVVLNRDGGDLWEFALKQKYQGPVKFRWTNQTDPWFASFHPREKARLLGQHNQDNLALAFAVAEEMGWPSTVYSAMLDYAGLPHRLENLGVYQGVQFINDSKATTMESVITAARGVCNSAATLHLLLGGKDKDLPWHQLAELAAIPNLQLYFFGACGEIARTKSGLKGPTVGKLAEVFPLLKAEVKPGDAVLLSPGGTSLDEFTDFMDRGRSFARLVKECFSP